MLFKELRVDTKNNFRFIDIWEEVEILHMLENANGCAFKYNRTTKRLALNRAKKNLGDIIAGKAVSFKLKNGYSIFALASEEDVAQYKKQEEEFESNYIKELIEYYEAESRSFFRDLKQTLLQDG